MLLFSSNLVYSQSEQNENKHYSNTYLGLGGIITSFQDLKSSNIQYNGIGGAFNFGYEKQKRNLFGISLDLLLSQEKAKTNHIGKLFMANAILSSKYLTPVLNNGNAQLFVGGTWDVVDINFRNYNWLNNSAITYISNSGIKLSTLYIKTLSSNLKLDLGLDFQLFGFVKEGPGFALIENQTMLEKGEFSYLDWRNALPYTLKYYNFEPFWDYVNLTTALKLHYKKRWAFSYRWNVQRSHRLENYPLTKGYNLVSVIYKLSNK